MLILTIFILVAQVFLSQAATIRANFIFSGVNRYFDISQFNFKRGLNNVYEYTFNTENTNKIFLYFYTLPANNSIVEVYNGKDDTAERISLAFLLPAFYNGTYTYPLAADTNGPNMFVRIRPLDPIATYSQDFQGLVTDFENPDSCDPLVFQINTPNATIDYIPFSIRNNNPCTHIIHALDTTNNPAIAISLSIFLKDDVNMNRVSFYKGLLSIEDNRLTSLYSIWAFDKHILVNHATDFNFSPSITFRPDAQRFDIGDSDFGMLMTKDYLPYMPNFLTEQILDYKFEIDFSGNVSTVEFLFPQTAFRMANVTVQIWNGNTPTVTTYSKTPPTITAYGRAVLIDYQCLQGWGLGLYATFRDGRKRHK